MKRQFFAAASLLLMLNATAQTPWLQEGNSGTNPTLDFVGTDDNWELVFRTDDLFRFRLNKTETYGTLGGFNTIPANGFGLITPNTNFINNAPGPYSLLHLAAEDDNAQQDSYRPWMNTGITFTGNKDHGYVGQKALETDETDMIIHWSDNPGEWLKDRLRFIFTSGYDGNAQSGAQSEEGLEFMRLWPNRYEDPHIGVGDFYAANLNDANITEPTERLDMVNGRLRIRQLPEDNEHEGTYKVMVVDDAAYPGGERGVVKWVDPAVLTGSPDCDWIIQNDGSTGSTLPHSVVTALGSSDTCPDATDAVGIGIALPDYKLDVYQSDEAFERQGGLRVVLDVDNASWRTGISSEVRAAQSTSLMANAKAVSAIVDDLGTSSPTGAQSYGVFARSNTTRDLYVAKSFGAYGDAVASSGTLTEMYGGHFTTRATGATVTHGFGVWGEARRTSGDIGAAYGVFGYAVGADDNFSVYAQSPGGETTDWAIYSTGRTFTPGGLWTSSDLNLKQNVQDVEASSMAGVLQDIQLHTYEFDPTACPQLTLPTGEHLGLIAQELEALLPQLVTNVHQPEALDPEGNIVHPAFEHKAVNYLGMIPYLIAGHQVQQASIAELQAMIGQLQQQVANCCAQPNSSDVRQLPDGLEDVTKGDGRERLLTIQPNPFTDHTTIRYQLERGGRVMLLVNSSDGKQLQVLQEATQSEGEYRYEWTTGGLAPGIYYVSLLLDGEPLVKRAVKVQ